MLTLTALDTIAALYPRFHLRPEHRIPTRGNLPLAEKTTRSARLLVSSWRRNAVSIREERRERPRSSPTVKKALGFAHPWRDRQAPRRHHTHRPERPRQTELTGSLKKANIHPSMYISIHPYIHTSMVKHRQRNII